MAIPAGRRCRALSTRIVTGLLLGLTETVDTLRLRSQARGILAPVTRVIRLTCVCDACKSSACIGPEPSSNSQTARSRLERKRTLPMTMYHDTRQLFTLVLASGLVSACSGSDSTGLPPTNVGGQSSANGGGSNSGGANGLGGGSPGAGRSSTQGGAPSSGGAPSGGAPAGGAPGTGGVQI